jgi:hypothetical protein
MSLSSTTTRSQFTANGSTTVFPFPYYFIAQTHLRVTVTNTTTGVSTLQVITTDYTVSGAADPAGGSVTFVSAPTNARRVTIERIAPLTQATDYVLNDNFPSSVLEEDLDKLTMIVQQMQDAIDRSIKFPSTDAAFEDETGSSVDRVSKILGFDSTGAISLLATTGDSASAAAAAVSAAAAAASAAAAVVSAAAAAAAANPGFGLKGYTTTALAGTDIDLTFNTSTVDQELTGSTSAAISVKGLLTGTPTAGSSFFVSLVGVILTSSFTLAFKSNTTTLFTLIESGTYNGMVKMTYTGTAWVARILHMESK